jgi:Fe2+ transport system protein FeoA
MANLVELVSNQSHAQSVTIQNLSGDPELVHRLREVGLCEGRQIELIGRIVFGGPVIVRVGPIKIALRDEEAKCCLV